ncbi:MAG: NAD(P)/FAD-dependent oxidoreductase [Actinobacteria bacterium]|nr:NAD(P)/FAD-dependent oxidoreductase [Actinomycetota bacterium]
MPTKTLLRSAEIARLLRKSSEFGFSTGEIKVDFEEIMRRKDRVVGQLREGGRRAIQAAGISLIEGAARFKSSSELEVNGETLRADRYIIASGSVPVIPEIEGLNETGFITSNEALELEDKLPTSIIIVGGSYVGLEFATFFNSLGVKTTVVEAGARIARTEDEEVSTALHYYMTTKLGIEIYTRSRPVASRLADGDKVIEVQTPDGLVELRGEELMLAVGRRPYFDDLNIAAAGIQTGRLGIPVDEYLRTNVGHIYAVGDVTGSYQLAHFAAFEGGIAGANAVKGDRKQVDYRVVPRAMFTYPEVGSVGMTEAQARQAGIEVAITVERFAGKGKPMVMGEEWGFVKVIADARTKEIVGAHIIGVSASDLIHEFAVEMQASLPADVAARTIHVEPTLATVSGEAMDEMGERLKAA